MENSELDLNKLVSMISENVTKPLQQEIQTLKQEIQTIKDEQQVSINVRNADRVYNHYDHIIASLRHKKKITVAFLSQIVTHGNMKPSIKKW